MHLPYTPSVPKVLRVTWLKDNPRAPQGGQYFNKQQIRRTWLEGFPLQSCTWLYVHKTRIYKMLVTEMYSITQPITSHTTVQWGFERRPKLKNVQRRYSTLSDSGRLTVSHSRSVSGQFFGGIIGSETVLNIPFEKYQCYTSSRCFLKQWRGGT